MNRTLLKETFRSNFIVMLVVALVVLMYTSIIITMYDPESTDSFRIIMEMMPEGLLNAMGFGVIAANLTSFIANYLYGFIYIMFPMIYIIIVANNLIAKHVDRGSMAYLLSTPNSRIKIAGTQGFFMLASLTTIMILETVTGIIISEAVFKGLLEIDKYIALNVITLFVLYVVSGIGFFFSCISNHTKHSLAFGAGIPIGFFVIKMLSGAAPDLEGLRYFTIYSFIDIDAILTQDHYVMTASLILLAVTAVLYSTGIFLFNKRSLII